jgi:hypothetical protein
MRLLYSLLTTAFLIATFVTPLSAQTKFVRTTYDIGDTIGYIRIDSTTTNRHFLRVYTIEKSKNGKNYKNKGEIIFYDLDAQKELWRKPYNYKFDNMIFSPEGIIHVTMGQISLLQFEDGKPLWSKSGSLKLNDVRNNQLLWYTGSPWKDQRNLEAHDIKSGNKKWSTIVGFGWNDTHYLNDSLLCIKTEGLIDGGFNLLNLHNGKKYFYRINRGGISKTGLYSNVLYDDSTFYIADSKKIFCLNDTLGEQWSTELPKGAASKSVIYRDSTRIIMINYGIGANLFSMKKDWNHQSVGYPFIAGFNQADGKQIFFKRVSEGKAQMRDSFSKAGIEYMIFDNQLVYCMLNDTAQVRTIPWDTEKYGKLKGLYGGDVYFANSDHTIYRQVRSDYYRILVYNDRGSLYEVDKDMQVVTAHPYGTYSFPVTAYGDHVILKSPASSDYVFTNSLGVNEGSIKSTDNPQRITNRLFFISPYRTQVIEVKL